MKNEEIIKNVHLEPRIIPLKIMLIITYTYIFFFLLLYLIITFWKYYFPFLFYFFFFLLSFDGFFSGKFSKENFYLFINYLKLKKNTIFISDILLSLIKLFLEIWIDGKILMCVWFSTI